MGNANWVLSKMQSLDHVWDYDFRGDTGIVESYVSVLRRKVDTTEPHLLHTLRGVGYVLRRPSTYATDSHLIGSGAGPALAAPACPGRPHPTRCQSHRRGPIG